MKDVDNDLEVIENDPLAGWEPVNRHGSNRVVLSQSGFNFVCDRFKLGLRAGGADYEEIRERRDRAQIQHNDVFRLFVRGELRASFR